MTTDRPISDLYREIGIILTEDYNALHCRHCGHIEAMSTEDAARYTAHGYPRHCGRTMRLTRVGLEEIRMAADLDARRGALILAARGDDVDAIAAAAGALSAALIRQGQGRDEWESLLADLDARRCDDAELAAIGAALRALEALERPQQLRAIGYVCRRLGVSWSDLPS